MTTEERLEILEEGLTRAKRSNRYLLISAILIVSVLIMARCLHVDVKTAEAKGKDTGKKVVSATEFILEDENGKVRGKLMMSQGAPTMVLYDENGYPRMVLAIYKEGPNLSLVGEKNNRITINASHDTQAIEYSDEKGRPQLTLSSNKDTKGLYLAADNDTVLAALCAIENLPLFRIRSQKDKEELTISAGRDAPNLTIIDKRGHPFFIIGMEKSSHPADKE